MRPISLPMRHFRRQMLPEKCEELGICGKKYDGVSHQQQRQETGCVDDNPLQYSRNDNHSMHVRDGYSWGIPADGKGLGDNFLTTSSKSAATFPRSGTITC